MRYDIARTAEVFTVTAVDADFNDTARTVRITGGSVELGAYTDTRMDATADFEGADIPADGPVRIRYSFDAGGEHCEAVLATGFATVGDVTFEGATASGSMTVESVLRPLAADGPGYPFTVSASADAPSALALAEDICLRYVPRVQVTGESAWRPTSDHTFDAGDSWLAIVNWLLDGAGYAAAHPDPYGTVIMAPYVAPGARPVTAEYATDSRSVIMPGVVRTVEGGGAVVRLSYADESCSLTASARIGGGILTESVRESVDELAGGTAAGKLEALKALAARRAVENAGSTDRLRFKAAWRPLQPNDAISFDYVLRGAERIRGWRGTAASMQVSFEPGAPTDIEARRFVPADASPTVEGSILWQAT